MDLIEKLQAYKEEVNEIISKEKDYHKASKMSFIIDSIDNLIKDITKFEDILSA